MHKNILALSILLSSAGQAEVVDPTSVRLDETSAATVMERRSPVYPTAAARRGQEGWVQVSFVIKPDGTVADTVIEDSSGIKGFERATVRAVEDWLYTPAARNGEPIQQCQNRVMMYFQLDGGVQGVRKNFKRRYLKAAKALNDDIEKADTLLDELKQLNSWNLYEDSRLWSLDAVVAKELKDKPRELKSIGRALAAAAKPSYVGEETYQYLLMRKIALQLENSDFAEVLDTFEDIKASGIDEQALAQLQKNVDSINRVLASDVPVVSHKHLALDSALSHRLLRSKFQISDIQGALSSVDIRCDNHRTKFTATEDTVWHIPEGWGQCFVLFDGEEGSQFDVVELAATYPQ